MKKKIILYLFLICSGAGLALTGLRYAPIISFAKGITLQQKVCPMFAVQDTNYRALEAKYTKLKEANKTLKKEKKEELLHSKKKREELEKTLEMAEKVMKKKMKSRRGSNSGIYQDYLKDKEKLKLAVIEASLKD